MKPSTPAAEERAAAGEAGLEETRELLNEQIAETEAERKRAALMAEKLRALGVNPDELTGS
jgi:hypothetical protein